MDKIYLDNAATTKPAGEVVEVMTAAQKDIWGNPSSIHSLGQKARIAVDEARELVAEFLEVSSEEVIFTSGGSESNNLAIRGVVEAFLIVNKGIKPHIITSKAEHHSVLKTVEELEEKGVVEVTYLPSNRDGLVFETEVLKAIKKNTLLVSLIYVNNETGVVNPISKIGKEIEEANKKRDQKIVFHVDAVQATEYFDIRPNFLRADLLTFTAHKLHGPRGAAVLYVKKSLSLSRQISGGDQEWQKRAGTENVPAILGLKKALELVLIDRQGGNKKDESLPELIMSPTTLKTLGLRQKLESGLIKIKGTKINGSISKRSPHILNISFANAEGEAIILNLDFMGIFASTGSACTSRSLSPSHVLSAMGVPDEDAHGSVRFSLSRFTKEEEIDKVLEVVPKVIKKLRELSPFKE